MKHTLAALLVATIALSSTHTLAQDYKTGRTSGAATDNVIGNTDWGQTLRNFNGVETYGEPFKTLSDGTAFYETEGPAVAVTPNGGVYAVSRDRSVDYTKPLGTTKVTQKVTNTATQTNDSVLRKFGSLLNLTSGSKKSESGIKPFSFSSFKSDRASGSSEKTSRNNYAVQAQQNDVSGFALPLSPEQVRERQDSYMRKYGGGVSLLADATNGDGTFMGRKTGNVLKGTFTGLNGPLINNPKTVAKTATGTKTSTATRTKTSTATGTNTSAPKTSIRPTAKASTYTTPNTGPR